MPRVHLYSTLCYSVRWVVSETISHLRSIASTCTNSYTHIHTVCWSLTLLHTVVIATPLREDTQAATPVKSACLSSISLPFSFIHTYTHTHPHTHTPSFSFTASYFYLSSSLLSLSHPFSFSFSPCITVTHLSACLPPSNSQANVNMSSHFSNLHHVYLWLLFHFHPHSPLCLSHCFPCLLSLFVYLSPWSILRDTEYICDWGSTSPLVASPIKGEIYRGNQSEGSLGGQL